MPKTIQKINICLPTLNVIVKSLPQTVWYYCVTEQWNIAETVFKVVSVANFCSTDSNVKILNISLISTKSLL